MATEQQRVDNMDFTTGNIFKKLVGFMIPILGALILQTMYGAVDIVVVGWFGTETSISAVSTGSSLINMIVFILCGLAMGVTVLMGRYIGEGNERRLGRVIGGCNSDISGDRGNSYAVASCRRSISGRVDAGTCGRIIPDHHIYTDLWRRNCFHYWI